MEYLDIDSNKEKVWSSIQIPNVKMSIWKDSNNFFHTNNSYSEPNEINFKLIDKFIDYETDLTDERANITLNLNSTNQTQNYIQWCTENCVEIVSHQEPV